MLHPIWALVVGEYPPQSGGVADYTEKLAEALAAAGDEVHVYAPLLKGPEKSASAVHVHRLPDLFGLRGLWALHRFLASLPKSRQVLVQYVPQSFGMRGCNIPFALSLSLCGRIWIMFHEVTVTIDSSSPIKYRIQAFATRMMARLALRVSSLNFISTELFEPLIRKFGAAKEGIRLTPVPSNIPTSVLPDEVMEIRQKYAVDIAGDIIGHFGTYREEATRAILREMLPALLESDAQRCVLLLGVNSDTFAQQLVETYPALGYRIFGTGALEAQVLSNHLAACTVLLQPYERGVTTRRGSVTAGLALGVPTVTVDGSETEALWRESGAVALTRGFDVNEMIARTNDVLKDRSMQELIAERARTLYRKRFALEHTVEALYDEYRRR